MLFLLILVYMFCMFCYLANVDTNKFIKIFLLLIPIPVAFFDPIEADRYSGHYLDTVRMFAEMDALRRGGWDVWTPYDDLLGSKIYIYFFALLGNNYIMPVVTCFLVYTIVMCASIRVIGLYKQKNKIALLSLISLILLINYLNVVTNIRYPLAVALFIFVLVLDVFEKKPQWLCLLLYIMIANLHSGILLLVGIRYIAKYKLRHSLVFLSIFLFVVFSNIDQILNLMLQNDSGLIYQMASKQAAYEDYTRSFTPAFRLSCGIIDISILIIIVSCGKIVRRYMPKEVYNSAMLLSVLGLYFSFSYTLWGDVLIQRVETFTSFYLVLLYMVLHYERINLFVKLTYYFTLSYVFLFQIISCFKNS